MAIKGMFGALALTLAANAAQFDTYYSSDRPATPQAPAAREPFTINRAPQAPAAQNKAPNVKPQSDPIIRAPFQTSKRTLSAAPHGHFGLNGSFLIRASVGFGALDRKVSVDTLGGGEAVYYRPTNTFMGYANGGRLKHDDRDTRWRYQLGAGYQLPNEGNFWYLEYAYAEETREIDASYALSLPSARIANTIPYIKFGANVGFSDSKKHAPSSFGVLLGIGGYNYLNAAKSFRLEYGADYSRTEWLPISRAYGDEEWTDNLWHIYLGAAYRF
ncbi:MAG: hypothetical protein LBO72_07580 [Helicobacteraceae bacterium]|nr:hypothetical protein [Helicobacteraceae bacterium]